MVDKASGKPLLRKQPAMRKVLWALTPCVAGGVYYFGWRSLAMVLFCCAVGFLVEWLFCRQRNEPVSEAVFVTATLYALIMPPAVGWHILAVGMIFAIAFAKEVFGGFGRNIFNPAMAGRCFVYICFPVALTGVWPPAANGGLGALTRWTTAIAPDGTAAITSATPMAHIKSGLLQLSDNPSAKRTIPFIFDDQQPLTIYRKAMYRAQFIGNISGTMGVTSAGLILLGGIYLFWSKVASRETILTVILSYLAINYLLVFLKVPNVPGPWAAVLGGGFLLGAFFMATDPVSSPKTFAGRIIYGLIIGITTAIIRNFSIFNGGFMFALLLGNMFAPIIDYAVKAIEDRRMSKEAAG